MPAVKLDNIGASVVVCIAEIQTDLPVYVYGSNPPVEELNQDGQPKKQDRVIGLVKFGDGASIKDREGTMRAVEPGDVVSIWLSSWNRWEWNQAKMDLNRSVEVGDLLRWRYERDEAPSRAGNSPRKVRTCALQTADPAEKELVDRAEGLYHDLHRQEQAPRPLLMDGPFDQQEPPPQSMDGDQAWHETTPEPPSDFMHEKEPFQPTVAEHLGTPPVEYHEEPPF